MGVSLGNWVRSTKPHQPTQRGLRFPHLWCDFPGSAAIVKISNHQPERIVTRLVLQLQNESDRRFGLGPLPLLLHDLWEARWSPAIPEVRGRLRLLDRRRGRKRLRWLWPAW